MSSDEFRGKPTEKRNSKLDVSTKLSEGQKTSRPTLSSNKVKTSRLYPSKAHDPSSTRSIPNNPTSNRNRSRSTVQMFQLSNSISTDFQQDTDIQLTDS